MEPTDRSNSPEIINNVIPIAMIPGTAWLLRMEERELFERKVSGVAREKNRNTDRKLAMAPASGDLATFVRIDRSEMVKVGCQVGFDRYLTPALTSSDIFSTFCALMTNGPVRASVARVSPNSLFR